MNRPSGNRRKRNRLEVFDLFALRDMWWERMRGNYSKMDLPLESGAEKRRRMAEQIVDLVLSSAVDDGLGYQKKKHPYRAGTEHG